MKFKNIFTSDKDSELKEVSAEEMMKELKEAGVPKELRNFLASLMAGDEGCCTPEDCDGSCEQAEDNVNHPKHYQSDTGIECIDAIRAALGLEGFVSHCRGTAIKYAWRSGDKDEKAFSEDLRKGAWYLTRAANELEMSRES